MTTVPCRTLTGGIRDVPIEAISFRPAAYGLIINEGEILLLRNRHTGKYIFPGGGVHIGERLEAAVIREVQEETGLTVTAESLAHLSDYCFYYAPSDEAWHCLSFFYHCRFYQGILQNDAGSDKEDAEPPRWVARSALTPEDFQPHFIDVLSCINDL